MVNTFVTQSHLPSAIQDLDDRRLGKQRVEAYQILNLLLDAIEIVKFFKYKEDTPFLEIWKKYKQEPTALVMMKDKQQYISVPRKDLSKYTSPYRKITGGFASHPIVSMWVGYQEGLKLYITICIDEWISRGFKNTMTRYPTENKDPELPWWVDCPAIHKSHTAALLRKEFVRNEPEWYVSRLVFESEWFYHGYVWIPHLDQTQINLLRNNFQLAPEDICDPILNDFV